MIIVSFTLKIVKKNIVLYHYFVFKKNENFIMPHIKIFVKQQALLIVLLFFASFTFAQKKDTTKYGISFKSGVALTNNGFSFIPSFSLGKPAAIVNLAIGGKKLSFEPEFRFSLEGKPWSFIFIWRYKILNTQQFQLTAGVHLPALNYKTVSVIKNGILQNVIQTQRFVSFEATPNFNITKNISIGMLYLYGYGVESDAIKNTHLITLRSSFSNIKLLKYYAVKFNPQIFYLNMDKVDGYYASWGCTVSKQNFPLSISTMMYKPIATNITGKNFDWNISLIYSFNKNFISK